MPLTDENRPFFDKLANLAGAEVKRKAREKKRNELIKQHADIPDSDRAALRKGMTFQIHELDKKGKQGKAIQSLNPKGAEKEVETKDIVQGKTTGLGEAELNQVGEAWKTVVDRLEKLRSATDDDGNPLFDADDLADEFFEPMVREGLVPENFVDKRYSKTQKMLDASRESYLKALDEKRQDLEDADAGDWAKAGMSDTAAMKREGKQQVKQMKQSAANQFAAYLGQEQPTEEEGKRILTIAKDANKVQKTGKKAEGNVAAWLLGDPVQAASNAASQAQQVDPVKGSVKILTGVAAAVKVAAAPVKYYKKSQKLEKEVEDDDWADDVADEVAALVEHLDRGLIAAVAAIDPDAGKAVRGAYRSSLDVDKAAELLTKNRKVPQANQFAKMLADAYEAALKVDGLGEAGADAAKAFLGAAIPSQVVDNLGKKGGADPLRPMFAAGDQAAAAAAANKDFLDAARSPGGLKALKDAVREKQNKAAEEELEQSNKEVEEFENQLTTGRTDPEKLLEIINQLKLDLAQLKLAADIAKGLGKMGLSAGMAADAIAEIAGSVVPALRAFQVTMKLAVSVMMSVKRWQLWKNMRARVEVAESANSNLRSAIKGFLDRKNEEVMESTIEQALLGVQLAGAIAEAVPEPISQAVGKTAYVVGKAGEATHKLAQDLYNESEIRRAWLITINAVNNPENRKLGLKALRLNGTLAMHAVAWAADQGDRVAREFLSACGISERTLSDPGSTPDKVIEYLGLLLNERRTFMDTEQVKVNWRPKPIELTPLCWLATLRRARTEATPRLGPKEPAGIVPHLKAVERLTLVTVEQLEGQKPEDVKQHFADAEVALNDVAAELRGYVPLSDTNQLHSEMKLVIEVYLKEVDKSRLVFAQVQRKYEKAIA